MIKLVYMSWVLIFNQVFKNEEFCMYFIKKILGYEEIGDYFY